MKLTTPTAVGSGDLLGCWRIWIKTMNNTTRKTDICNLRAVDDGNAQLAEMLNYPGPVAVLIAALEREGVRLDELRLRDEDITYKNPYVAIIRGESAEILHRAKESLKSRVPTHQAGENLSLSTNGSGFGRLHVNHLASDVIHKSKTCKQPNVES